ncbi:hypothetical protein H2198_000412 [Neophaeococcomyces mojaviensis]|uniref:Uncharacterized protein n=1 Tax=Neophaeococcomyces mojaviensis TaxID=3383035 RepID=A0ACC3AJZ4_9EURO|nr:hypothetical protein H2198_000412 [Knufia sp. JES_112]
MTDATKENLAIILVPGSFSPPHFYAKVSRQLVIDGFSNVRECQLLSAAPLLDQRHPPAKIEDDALYIREVIQAYLEKGKDVIVVMNSYAGLPGTEAIKGLPSRSTLTPSPADGASRNGGVVGMIYLSSFLPFPGDTLRSLMSDSLFEPLKSGTPGGYMILPNESGPGIFNDLYAAGKEAEAKYQFEQMITHSSDSFDGKVTNDIWSKENAFQGQVVYIIGECDVVVPPTLAEGMISKVAETVENKVKVVRVQDGGHVMHVSKPDEVVAVVEGVVADLQKASAT